MLLSEHLSSLATKKCCPSFVENNMCLSKCKTFHGTVSLTQYNERNVGKSGTKSVASALLDFDQAVVGVRAEDLRSTTQPQPSIQKLFIKGF